MVAWNKTYTIYTKTAEDKTAWIGAIQGATQTFLEENPQYKGTCERREEEVNLGTKRDR